MYDFSKVKGDYKRYSDTLKKNFESTSTAHMNCIENPESRKNYEPISVKYDIKNHRHVVKTRGAGKFYYTLGGEWY